MFINELRPECPLLNPASCVGCAPRRASERRAAAASRQVALAAAEFARLWILAWTLVCSRLSSAEVPPLCALLQRGTLRNYTEHTGSLG